MRTFEFVDGWGVKETITCERVLFTEAHVVFIGTESNCNTIVKAVHNDRVRQMVEVVA